MVWHQQCLDPLTHPDYVFNYCPSFPAAILFSILFGLASVAHLVQAIHYRKAFCWVVIMASSWETGGFIMRIVSILNPTLLSTVQQSQILILLSPLWINAFLYMLMARFVYFFVPEKRVIGISAQRLSLCFVLLDISAFVLQLWGGLQINSTNPSVTQRGIHIYMGGIGLQQFFICGFVALVIRFHYKMTRLDGSSAWKRPLYTMYASLFLITVRIIYRLIEFSSGIESPLTQHEAPFYVLEATPMVLAIVLWNVFHPGQVLVGPESEFPKKSKKSKNLLPQVGETNSSSDFIINDKERLTRTLSPASV